MTTKSLPGLLAILASAASSVAFGTEVLPPPPYIRVLITATEVPTGRLQVGQEYAVHITQQASGAYTAVIVNSAGMKLYENVPARTVNCTDSSQAWPDHAEAAVLAIASAAPPASCVIDVRLDLTAVVRWPRSPAEQPTRNIPYIPTSKPN